MPNTKAAKRELRKSQKREMRNQVVKSSTKNLVKKFNRLIAAGEIEQAQSILPQVVKKLDTACSKGVFHRNKSARIKSRLYHRLHKASAVDEAVQAD